MLKAIDYSKALLSGMNLDWRARTNVPALSLVKGLQACEQGLRRYKPFNVLVSDTALFPDIFMGKRRQLAFFEDEVIDIETTFALVLYDFSTYNPATDGATVGAATAGGQWHFMDFYDSWMATNGACVVFKAAFSTKTFVSTLTSIQSFAQLLEGRAVLAGFDSTDAIWTDLKTLYEAGEADLPSNLQGLYTGLDSTWALWTSVGGAELMGLQMIEFLKYGWFDDSVGGYTDTNTLLFDLIRKGQFGARPLLQNTDVYRVMPMGSSAIVYQQSGATPLWNQPEYATFGVVNPQTGVVGVADLPEYVGPKARGCIGGNDNVHLFLSDDFDLWLVEKPGTARRIKASHHMKVLDEATVRIAFDPLEKDFYISGVAGTDQLSFCLSHTLGLTRCPKSTPSITMYGGVQGAWVDSDDGPDVLVRSMPFSLGHPSVGERHGDMGVLHEIVIDGIGADWVARVYFRWRLQDDWTLSGDTDFDERGHALVDCPGVEWMAEVFHPDYTDVEGIESMLFIVRVGESIPFRAIVDASAPAAMTPQLP